MKAIYLGMLISIIFIFACGKREFQEIPVEDSWGSDSAQYQELNSTLQQNKHWEFIIQDGFNEAAYYGFLNLKNQNTADFICDFSANYSRFSEIPYTIASNNRSAMLNFPRTERVSNFSKMAEDAVYVDTSYVLQRVHNDTLFFIGQLKKARLKMFPGTSQTYEGLKSNKIEQNRKALRDVFQMPKFFFRIQKDNQQFEISHDSLVKTINFYYKQGEQVKTIFSPYYFDRDRLVFLEPIHLQGTTFESLTIKSMKDGQAEYEKGIQISNESAPKLYDEKTAISFKTNFSGAGWGSRLGFSSRTKPDIAEVYKIFNYQFTCIFPLFINEDNPPVLHGLIAFVLKNGELSPGIDFPITSFNNNYTFKLSEYKIDTYLGPDPQVKISKDILYPILYNEKGFYLIQRGNGMYMVDARDALIWAYFEPIFFQYK